MMQVSSGVCIFMCLMVRTLFWKDNSYKFLDEVMLEDKQKLEKGGSRGCGMERMKQGATSRTESAARD